MAYPKGLPKSKASKRRASKSMRLAYAEGRHAVRPPGEIVLCSVEKCGDSSVGQGLCRKHYQRMWKHGDPAVTKRHSKLDVVEGHRWCSRCQCHLPLERFAAYKTCYCKQCTRERVQIRKYGVAVPRDACCEICGGTHRLAIDHCHDKGHVRGVLCHACNVAIGLLRHNEQILVSAIAYIEKTKCPPKPPTRGARDC